MSVVCPHVGSVTALLDGISEWVCRNTRECRPQDLVSFLLTLAHVGHTPTNIDQVLEVRRRKSAVQDFELFSKTVQEVWV